MDHYKNIAIAYFNKLSLELEVELIKKYDNQYILTKINDKFKYYNKNIESYESAILFLNNLFYSDILSIIYEYSYHNIKEKYYPYFFSTITTSKINSYDRKFIHLMAEGNNFVSQMSVNPDKSLNSCLSDCKICVIKSYKNGTRTVQIIKSPKPKISKIIRSDYEFYTKFYRKISKKNRGKKRMIMFERYKRLNKKIDKWTLKPQSLNF
jgi:hypothetical protein